jgi:hypothetical protein
MDGEPVTAEATGATFVPRTTDDPASAAARVLDAVAERGKTDDTAPAIVAGMRIAPKDDGFHVSDMRDVATLPDDALFATRDGETLSRADAEKLVRSAIALRDRPGTALHDALVESGIPVEDLAAAPEAALRDMYDRLRERMPVDRSPTPAQDVQPTPEPAARAANAPPDQATARTDAGAQPSQPRTAGADAGVESRTGLDPARDREVERARVVAAERPDTPLDNGADVADALRAADEAVTQAQSQGDGIRAAIACFLRFGASAS